MVSQEDSCNVVLMVGTLFTPHIQNQPHTLLLGLISAVPSFGPSGPGGLLPFHAVLPIQKAIPPLSSIPMVPYP